jgi:hypothetical protein
MKRREKKEPPRLPTLADEWADKTRRACALQMVRWMAASIDLSRKVRSLQIEEADNMAQAVISEFIVQASQRKMDDSDEVKALHSLIG